MTKAINPARYILFILIFLSVGFYVYLISVHRVVGFEDIQSVIAIAQKPIVNTRCKAHNETHYYCLPNVLFIGASKCGTTSMVDYLSKHPNIRFVNRRIHKKDHHREVHRFDRNSFGYAMQSIDLMDEWASSPLLDSVDMTLIHYTPHYLYAPTVPYDVKQFYPHSSELKFIVMLRDPVERALSSYWFQNSHLLNGEDQGSIAEFMALASAEINDRRLYEQCMRTALAIPSGSDIVSFTLGLIQNRQTVNTSSNNGPLYQALVKCFGSDLRSKTLGHRHIDKGIYVDQVLRWWDNFRRDQFLFVSLKDMRERPKETFQKVLDFMNVIPASGKTLPQSHGDSIVEEIEFGKVRLQKPNQLTVDAPDYFKKILYEYYEPYNKQLSNTLNISVNL